MKSALVFLVLGWLTALAGAAQDVFKPDSVRRRVAAVHIAQDLKIDGYLDEPAWQQAAAAKSFVQVEPLQGQPAGFDTEVRVLYNHYYLYFGIFCRDSVGKKAIRVPDLRRDFDDEEQDVVGVVIDGFNDKRNAMAFMVNPYGSQRDLLAFDDMMFDEDWDGRWKVRTHRLDSGWTAEFAIPWHTLRYPKAADGEYVWGINFVRNRRASNELTAWSPYPRAFSVFRMEYAGELTGIRPPPPVPNVQVTPYVLGTNDRYNNSAWQPSLKAGGEVKWAINSNSVLDLTFNTDFAQADADRQVNNLSRFSVFFPERRQFFLENASLFGAGLLGGDDIQMQIQPFFSRRIGLDAEGNPLPIVAGARYVHRSLTHNYGAMLMRQGGDAAHAPVTYAVGRYSRNIGEQNRIGGIVTYRDEEARYGQPANRNAVAAADAFVRLSPSLSLNAMVAQSMDTDPTARGTAAFAQLDYNTNHGGAFIVPALVTAGFDAKTGFVSRHNVMAINSGAFLNIRKERFPEWLRALEPGIFPEIYFDAQTRCLQEFRVSVNPVWVTLQSGGFLGVFFDPTFQRLDDTFSPVGIDIQPGSYRYLRSNAMAGSDPSKKVSYFVFTSWGGYYDGRLWSKSGSVRLSPVPHFQMNFSYENNRFRSVGVRRENADVHLWSIESRVAVNPRLQLIGFYQFNSSANREVWNVRLSWEFRPLSFVYLVFNRRGFDHLNERQNSSHLIGKVTYLKQF
ncbi:carbohydrate binding family 9 domain-containing protein [Rhodoflexus caldus]|uniref:carbohydrate binding family 9 domain-containing protein n=1 Tax=Rhodoflexus caldus TaxID=2891236 RepID=UPI002029BAF2|nr:DUF5916 domain-containing protein [Rhodoflexus caldus]